MNATTDPILAFRTELHGAALRRSGARRRHRLILLAALAAMTLTAGFSIAGTGWLTGEPAPRSVVEDFQAYTPQLGFHPEPGKAVLVAQDGAIKLYATTNREGTYCLVVDEPWKRPQAGDGGTCVLKTQATATITAGVIGGSGGQASVPVWVVAGRVSDAEARTIRFTALDGERIERPVGPSGFYVAAVQTTPGCPPSDWQPTFVALGSDGKPLAASRILLIYLARVGCGFSVSPHGPSGSKIGP